MIKKVAVLLTIVGFIVYGNSLFNGFVFDDEPQLVNNPLVHSLSNIPYFIQGGTFFDEGSGQIIGIYYKPVLSTSFALLYTIFGAQPFGFHFVQLLLHIANALLIFILFRKFFKEKLSLLLSILFLVHPINQEATVYISDLQDVLFFFFGMVSLFISRNGIGTRRRLVFVCLFLFLSLLTKETGVLFVPILLLYQWLFYRKHFITEQWVSLLCVTGFYLYLHFGYAHLAGIGHVALPIMKEPLSQRFISMPAIVWYYFQTFLWPYHLVVAQLWVVANFSFKQFYLPLLLDVLVSGAIGWLGYLVLKKAKAYFALFIFFTAWLVLGLLMHIQILPLDMTVADRWFYFPFVGLLGLIGLAIQLISIHKKIVAKAVLIMAIVLLCLLAIRTMVRNMDWTNAITLYRHDYQLTANNYSMESNYGLELMRANQYKEANEHFARAVQLAPEIGTYWLQYGDNLEMLGDITNARKMYIKSIQSTDEVGGYVSLAKTYLKDESTPEKAKEILLQGLQKYPNNQRLYMFLAVAEFRLHNTDLALQIAQRAYQMGVTPESVYVLNQISNGQDVRLK